MTAPPALAPTTEPSAGVTSRASDSELATYYEAWCIVRGKDPHSTTAQKAFLMDGLGLTGCQAKALIRAYVLDERDREARRASHEEFGNWLASNYWRALRGGIYGVSS